MLSLKPNWRLKDDDDLGLSYWQGEGVSKVCSQRLSAQNLSKELEMLNKIIHEQKYELMKEYFMVRLYFSEDSYQLAEKITEFTVKQVPGCDSLASIYDTFKPLKQNLEKTMEEQLQVVKKKYSFENLWKDAKKEAGYG